MTQVLVNTWKSKTKMERLLARIPPRPDYLRKMTVTPEIFNIRKEGILNKVQQFKRGDFSDFASCVQILTYMIEDFEDNEIGTTLTAVRELIFGTYDDIELAEAILEDL